MKRPTAALNVPVLLEECPQEATESSSGDSVHYDKEWTLSFKFNSVQQPDKYSKVNLLASSMHPLCSRDAFKQRKVVQP